MARLPRVSLPALVVLVATPVLAWGAFPAGDWPMLAFVLAVPAIWWAGRAPAWRAFAVTLWLAWTATWLVLLAWLHHVTLVGLVLLAAFLGLLSSLWFLAARWALPRLDGRGATVRVLTAFGLAGLWVIGEWVRGWLFSGFPWLPLAASQWRQPIMLALCPYTGAHGVSFLLILFNLGVAAYVTRMTDTPREGRRIWFTPAFTAALVTLLVATVGLVRSQLGQQREPLARFALVQPYIPQTLKWDPRAAEENLRILEEETRAIARRTPDVILWPESAVPYVLKAQPQVQAWFESVARQAQAPLLAGAVVLENAGRPDETWINGAVVVDHERGLQAGSYAKRHLVPFGEYVPLGGLLRWIKKFVPIGDDFRAGTSAAPLVVSTPRGPVAAGVLVCYEDVFADLSRASVAAGADVLVNVTNNAWYGEGAAAYQHAAHSVLRAAETRRPVVRCGNGGWSGWIDEYGVVRDVLVDARGSVYFRGGGIVEVTRDRRWAGRSTPYVQFGDWWVGVCAVLAGGAWLALRRGAPAGAA